MSSMKSFVSSSSNAFWHHLPWGTVLSLFLTLPLLHAASDADDIRRPESELQPPARVRKAVSIAFFKTVVHLDSIRHPPSEGDEVTEGREELLFSNGTIENLVFGPRVTELEFFGRLNSELATRVELLGRTFELTHSQKVKLVLAGKKDIDNIRRRVNEFKQRLDKSYFVEKIDTLTLPAIHAWASEVVNEAGDFRSSLPSDPFLEESMLAKVLHHQLTSEQIAEYDRRELKLRVVPFGISRKNPEKI